MSEATVYATYGTKAASPISLVDSADADADVGRLVSEVAAADGVPACHQPEHSSASNGGSSKAVAMPFV